MRIDLQGEWALRLDEEKLGLQQHFEKESCDDTITLPSTISYAKKGKENDRRETGFLTDLYAFEGYAWYRKTVVLGEQTEGASYVFTMERTRISHVWVDGVYVGRQESFLSAHVYDLTPFIKGNTFELTVMVANVDYKAAGGHLTSQDTQTNWNGILGRIYLDVYERVRIAHMTSVVDADKKEAKIQLKVEAFGEEAMEADITLACDQMILKHKYLALDMDCSDWEKEAVPGAAGGKELQVPDSYVDRKRDVLPVVLKKVSLCPGENDLEFVLSFGEEAMLWDEEDPYLYEVKARICVGDTSSCSDEKTTILGLRAFTACGDHFEINHRPTFLRGRHDGMIFPLTGFAPMHLEGWLKHFKIAKDWGMNHVRFHTCCPPEAAFLAADLLGLYLQPEIPFWGSFLTEDMEGYTEETRVMQDFLTEEGFRILDSYAGHPSFVMMTMGNEPWGSPKALSDLELGYKKVRPEILYSLGSNGFQFVPTVQPGDDFFSGVRFSRDRLIRGSYAQCDAPLGHIQTNPPATSFDYDENICPTSYADPANVSEDGTIEIQYGTGVKRVKVTDANSELIPEVPVVSHEIGQYFVYPDYDEIPHYTGSLKPRNLEVFRERLEAAGLGDLAKDYFEASGALAMDCYKAELETAFRSGKLAGFQLLDLQDFSGQGTALVGPLNALMENKGILSAGDWRHFNSDAVIQAKFDSFVTVAGEAFRFGTHLAIYRKHPIVDGLLAMQLIDAASESILWEKTVDVDQPLDSGRFDLGDYQVEIPESVAPEKYYLVICLITEEDYSIFNEYTLWAYPKTATASLGSAAKEYSSVRICHKREEAIAAAKDGEKVLLLLHPEDNENSIPGAYCSDFWNYPMFNSISLSMNKPVPVGTLGLLIDEKHPALKDFPCETYSTPQWFHIVENSRSTILDGRDIQPIVRTMDNAERNHSLGLIYEEDNILVCGCDLEKLAEEHVEAKALLTSLLNYLAQ